MTLARRVALGKQLSDLIHGIRLRHYEFLIQIILTLDNFEI